MFKLTGVSGLWKLTHQFIIYDPGFFHQQYFLPRKINIEPENTPLEKENHLLKPSFSASMSICRGCIPYVPTTEGGLGIFLQLIHLAF